MSSIPEEIYHDILVKLPVKSLLACKCVCKSWYALISSPNFVKLHLKLTVQRGNPSFILNGISRFGNCDVSLYSIDHDSLQSLLSSTNDITEHAVELDNPFRLLSKELSLIGSCDGLVCLCLYINDTTRKSLCIWNATTTEYKELPKSPDGNDTYGICWSYFGYDSKSDDYKLIIWYESVVQVYSLRFNSWKIIDINVPDYVHYAVVESGLLFNGNSHWVSLRQDYHNLQKYYYIVVSLDISTERFKEMHLPKEVMDSNADGMLVVLEGCLCVLRNHVYSLCIDVWVVQDYGVQESWTKRFVIDNGSGHFSHMRLIWSSNSGEILIEANEELYYYDHKFGTVRKPYTRNLRDWRSVTYYFESLVSLNAGSYVREKDRIKESIHTRGR